MLQESPVVAIGGCGVGLSFSVSDFPTPGATVMADGLDYVNGGKASNHAIGLRRLGVASHLVSARGADPMGLRVESLLNEYGVRQEGILVGAGPTMVGALFVDSHGENVIVVSPGVLEELSPSTMRDRRALIAGAGTVVVSLEIPVSAAIEALRIAREAGTRTVLNLSPNPEAQWVPDLLALTDILVLNLGEAQLATGSGQDVSGRTLAERLLVLGAGAVVVTMGEEGALVTTANGSVSRPAIKVETVVDTSGAGDAFMCGLVASLHLGSDLATAADSGTRLASLILQGRGFVEALSHWEKDPHR